ncbi:MAG: 5'-3' exonuclease H3TH domain-containing protein [Dissulfurispiraceae bacterium]|jgi:DNA polymerase-1|nr:5'-3' exonuclease H3TH domain-containing protein [Dissulfurispiraceae bacterium]
MNIYLVDGNSYIYRAFHAIKGLTNSKGFPTNAIYGFTNMLMKIVRDKKPDALCIAFDTSAPTERHAIYESYKAQRPKMPDDLSVQIPHIKKIVNAFRFPVFEMPGYEADDIICTIAKKAADLDHTVYIVSGDKDMMQAVNERIFIFDPVKDAVINRAGVVERFGVEPERVPEVMAIAGDSIDNIPGVKGLGEKRAKELLDEAGSLDALIEHPEKITNERYRQMIIENMEDLKMSRTLATIDMNVPVDADISSFAVKEPDWSGLLEIFARFEFRSLIKLVPSSRVCSTGSFSIIKNAQELSDFLKKGCAA